MHRSVAAETLDALPHDDPAARRSRRDLRRVNRVMGSASLLAAALRRAVPVPPARPLRLLEIGCGDGLLLLAVARELGPAWRGTSLTLLDRQPIVDSATFAAYATLGWDASARVGDVLAWADGREGERFDVVVANLFLHHFDGAALARLLAACAARADALVACEPRRSAFALAASRLVGVLGANAVTREDAVLSVRAGFAGEELTAAWLSCHPERSEGSPRDDEILRSAQDDRGGWRCVEYDAGLFSHVFVAARRRGSP